MRAFVMPLVPTRLHARFTRGVWNASRDSVRTWPKAINWWALIYQIKLASNCRSKSNYCRLKSRPFRSLKFLTPGTSDAVSTASSSPEIFWPFLAVCLTRFLLNFDLRPSPSNSTEKSLQYLRLWFWSALFRKFHLWKGWSESQWA